MFYSNDDDNDGDGDDDDDDDNKKHFEKLERHKISVPCHLTHV